MYMRKSRRLWGVGFAVFAGAGGVLACGDDASGQTPGDTEISDTDLTPTTAADSSSTEVEGSGSSDPSSSSTTGSGPEDVAGVTAFHLTMADGVRIAVDLWLPPAVEDGAAVPTLLQATRYWRAVDRLPGAPPEVDRNLALATAAVDAGYAVLLVDARGSGASFGERQIPWSEEEQQDLGEVVRWATEQSWSNQRVAAWGISYDGNAADLLPAQDVEGLVAVVPMFTDYDPYLAIARPGGLVHEGFLQAWSESNAGLDANEVCALVPPRLCAPIQSVATGVKPVDEEGPALLLEAVAEHVDNANVFEAVTAAPYRDSGFGSSGISLDDVAPFSKQDSIEKAGVPAFAVASWLDGSTARSALQRFQTVQTPQRVVIGSWNHGASSNADPFLPFVEPRTPPIWELAGEMFGFITPLVMGAPPETVERSVRYFVLNGGGWQTSEVWPPAGVQAQPWSFGSDGTLAPGAPLGDEIDPYEVDFSATTGRTNRWFTQLSGDPVIYSDRTEEDDKLLTYTSAPFEAEMDLVGQAVVDLYVDVSGPEAAFYGYLEVIDEDGTVIYVSEGQLAGVHRRVASGPAPYQGLAVHHSFVEADAAPLESGEVNHVRFQLQPTAVRLHPGQRVRIALAGHDSGNFARVPERGAVTWQVHRSARWPSQVTLPVMTR